MKRSLGIFVFLLLLLAAPAVMAQQDCSSCTPQQDCSTECGYCADMIDHIDTCSDYEYTTCGERGAACNQTNCTPDWVETSRVTQGTYGEGYYFFCEHHSVEWVTQVDYNACNTNSYYNTNHYCHDETDGYKFGSGSDCCDGEGPVGVYNANFLCNHYHSCTG